MAEVLNLPTAGEWIRGDTLPDLTFRLLINGNPPTVDIAQVAIDLRRRGGRIYRYDSTGNADGLIVINGDGSFTLPAHILDIPGNRYDYDIEITYVNGVVATYVKGIWELKEDITKDV